VPRRILTHPDHDRSRSLGWLAVWWVETFVVHGRGEVIGVPIEYGDEYTLFYVDCYGIAQSKDVRKDGRRLHESAFLSRPKGTDKSGIAAAMVLFEAFGPARFGGWAEGGETYEFLGEKYTYQPGEPMGKPVNNPYVRIMATEEGQVGNTYDSVYHNLNDPEAPLFALQAAYGVDVGKTRVLVNGRPVIVPSTAGAASKDGGLETFAVFDETHLYNQPQLRDMFRVVSRNLRKRKKVTQTWYLETTTMYAPGEQSIAEETYELANMIEEGKSRRPNLLFDHRWGEVESLEPMKVPIDPEHPDETRVETEKEYIDRLEAAFNDAFGDAMAWNSLEAMMDGLFDPHQSESETYRYFFNALVEDANSWLKLSQWNRLGLEYALEVAKAKGERLDWVPPQPGDTITLGFDGGETSDATVLIACRVSDGYVWPIRIWEAPDTKAARHWRIDHPEVDAVVRQTFKDYKVVAFFADPPRWQDYVDNWERDLGPYLVVHASTKEKPIAFFTNQHAQMVKVIDRVTTAVDKKTLRHGNHKTLTRHVLNARRWHRTDGFVIGKDRHGSVHKMDAAVGMCLAYEACARYRKEYIEQAQNVPFRAR
jgi:phage terminase large subunit-like protein